MTFDCWNTLLAEKDWQVAHGLRVDALQRAARAAGLGEAAADRARVGRAFDDAWQRHMQLWEMGVASGAREVAGWAFAELGAPPRGAAFDELVARLEEASHSSQVVALEGAGETLERLASRGVRMALVCDTGLTPGRIVRRHLDRLGLLAHLDATVFSDEWLVPKPHRAVFLGALRELRTPPESGLHVGDLRRTDVAGAHGVGMKAVRIRALHDDRTGYPDADWVVDSHTELCTLIEGFGDGARVSR